MTRIIGFVTRITIIMTKIIHFMTRIIMMTI